MIRTDLALAALASAAVPGMKPVAVARIAQDNDSDHQQAVVEDATGRRWLVRSPLTPVAGARLRRGDELVKQLARHLPFKVPVPVGHAAVGRDGHAVVYPHVEGMPLDLTHLPAGPGLASAVGRAVAAVHNIPRGVFEEQDLPVFDAAACRQRLIAEVDRAAETGRVPTGLLARWEEAFDAAPLWQFATTPVHGEFRGSTVLVAFADEDAASGRVVAVTDWEEAMVADPAVDLAELYAQTSPAAWESVLDAYSLARAQRPDAYLHARARLVSETRRLRGLARAVAEDDETLTRRIVEALRRMDRLTEDDDSLVPATARGVGGTARTPEVAPRAAATASAAGAGEDVRPEPSGQVPAEPMLSHPGVPDPGVPDPPSSEPEVRQDDDDATAEVPVAAALASLREEEEAEAPLAEQDTHADSEAADSGTTRAVPTAGDGKAGPTAADPADAGDPADSPDPADASTPADEADAPHDEEERLHELYGMPSSPALDER